MYSVYCHKNKINNKLYIGITSQDVKKRWHLDGSGYKAQPKFWRAIQKYGWNNFEHIILFNNLEFNQASLIEQFLIAKYNTQKYGYNVTGGGEGLVNYHHSEETKQKMSQNALGKDGTNNRAVHCLELNKIFNSVKEAGDYFNVAGPTITRACSGIKPTAAGFHWCYEDEYNSNIIIPKMPTRSRPILCINTNDSFKNASEAAQWCNLARSGHIHEVCQGKRKTSGKHPITQEPLIWRYNDD